MLYVTITQILGDEAELLAQFSAGETGLQPLAGDRFDVVTEIAVIDPESGERVTCDQPERWARLLPLAFRSGDVAVLVEEREHAAEPADTGLLHQVEAEAARDAQPAY